MPVDVGGLLARGAHRVLDALIGPEPPPIVPDDVGSGWVPIRHRRNAHGGIGCGGVAVYVIRRLSVDDRTDQDDFRLVDGRRPSGDDDLRCGACGEHSGPSGRWDFMRDVLDQGVDWPEEVTRARPE